MVWYIQYVYHGLHAIKWNAHNMPTVSINMLFSVIDSSLQCHYNAMIYAGFSGSNIREQNLKLMSMRVCTLWRAGLSSLLSKLSNYKMKSTVSPLVSNEWVPGDAIPFSSMCG